MTKVIVAGGFGKLGSAAVAGLAETEFDVVGILSGSVHDADVAIWTGLSDIDVDADIWLDLSTPSAVYDNAVFALARGLQVVIGTTGLTDAQIEDLRARAVAAGRKVLIVPNFSLSAVLLMRFAVSAAQYFPEVEIVETHHPAKLDAPSGTAKVTAQRIAAVRGKRDGDEQSARGEAIDGVQVHALRLPGYVAQQSVYFGGNDEQLTLTQSTTSRAAFVPGILAALRGIDEIDGLAIGLESVLE